MKDKRNPDAIDKPMMVDEIETREDLVEIISYLIKLYWDMLPDWRGDNGEKSSKRPRIEDEAHAEYLVWFHRTKLSDLILLYGLVRQGHHLVKSTKGGAKPTADAVSPSKLRQGEQGARQRPTNNWKIDRWTTVPRRVKARPTYDRH